MSQKQFNKLKSINNLEINKNSPPDIFVSTAFLHQSPLDTLHLSTQRQIWTYYSGWRIFNFLDFIFHATRSTVFETQKLFLIRHNRLLRFPELIFQLNSIKMNGKVKQKRLNARKKTSLEDNNRLHPSYRTSAPSIKTSRAHSRNWTIRHCWANF